MTERGPRSKEEAPAGTKSKSKPLFYDRVRAEVARYAEGVHQLGEPASADEVRGLPDELASFLRSWNGAELFIDAWRIAPAAEIRREGDQVIFGGTANGDILAIAADGAILRVEEDTGETLVEGTSFARWIEGVVAAEGILYDREGEFREGVFEESGEELTAAAQEQRERKALKLDPDAPAPGWRLARALDKLGRADKALKVLAGVVAAAPRFGWAWFDLGRLERTAGHLAEAEVAFAHAAEADPEYEHAAYFAAHAARVAVERGDEAARVKHAARALGLDPRLARSQKEAATRLLDEGDRDAAAAAAALAAALAPRDLEVLDLVKRSR